MDSSSTDGSSSASAFVSSIIFNGVIFLFYISLFLILKKVYTEYYEKRAFSNAVSNELRVDPLPKGPFAWVMFLLKFPDSALIQKCGLDGYFFLRFLRLSIFICLWGVICLFPILFPVDATGGAGNTGLDTISFSNISEHKRNRYYAHIFCGWLYYWSILYILYTEFTFYLGARQAVLTSPKYAQRLSQRTVLFQNVPKSLLDIKALSTMFSGVRHIWINRDYKKLRELIEKRDKLAYKLEGTQTSLLKKAVKTKLKSEKKNKPLDGPVDELTTYMKKRPTHRLKFFGLFGKKVDTLDYAKENIPKWDSEITDAQVNFEKNDPLSSVFIEFQSPDVAQSALQSLAYHHPLLMTPHYTGVNPKDIIWSNMKLRWYEVIVKQLGTGALIVFLCVFWAIPVAFVGFVSNIFYLMNKLTFLRFLEKLPKVLFGLVSSLLPTVLLAVLMMLLPIILRRCAILQGVPTSPLVELHVQKSYFAFQVIQVFLVTTITSSAASVVTQIIQNPTSAPSLLASNLPKSSNFFISYIILQGLTISGGIFAQVTSFVIAKIFSFLDSTPRKIWARANLFGTPSWGTTFPVYTNLLVISLTYSLISPFILIITSIGFAIIYVAYLYNLIYSCEPSSDNMGLHYQVALSQTLCGLYLGNVCMIGLVAVGENWGCIVLQVVNLIVTVIVHLYLKSAFHPLFKYVPKSLKLDSAAKFAFIKYEQNNFGDGFVTKEETDYLLPNANNESYVLSKQEKQLLKKSSNLTSTSMKSNHNENEAQKSLNKEYENSKTRTSEQEQDAPSYKKQSADDFPILSNVDSAASFTDDVGTSHPNHALFDTNPYEPFPTKKESPFIRFFKPETYYTPSMLRSWLVPRTYYTEKNLESISVEQASGAYCDPAVTAKAPFIWIPKDNIGLSSDFVKEYSPIIGISDEGAEFTDKGKIVWLSLPPAYEPAVEI